MKCKSKPRARERKTKAIKDQTTFRGALDAMQAGEVSNRRHAKLLRDLKQSKDASAFPEHFKNALRRQQPHATTLPSQMLPPLP